MKICVPCLIFIFSAASLCTRAQTQKGYHLFRPAPRDDLRTFSIDRPDITESAITVDAGHFQFEGDLVKWTKDNQGTSADRLTLLSGLYKLGLTPSWDIHIGIEAYNYYADAEGRTYDEGFGSTMVRLKHNFWGNAGNTTTTFGMIPYIIFVSGNPADSDVIYGVGFPFSYRINDRMDFGAQPQFDFVLDEAGDRSLSFFQTVVLGGQAIGLLDFYIEGVAIFGPDTDQYLANGGLIYNVSRNVKIDVAVNQGLSRHSPTRVYLGLSFRI